MNLIFSHTSLTNNWFAPPHNRTRFEVGAARKSHKIVPCAVFSFTTSVLSPHLSPKLSAVLIKYFTSHTVPIFSLYHYLYSVLASKHPPYIWSNIYSAALVDYQTPLPCLIVYTLSYTINNILSFATEVREDDFCPLSSILCSCGELYQSPIERPLTAITLLLIHF